MLNPLKMVTPVSPGFSVKRQVPELIVPAKPTPHELKPLSDIDDQESLRFQVPVIMFYKNEPSMIGKDPVRVIREALGRALVFYYPFAGRLKEGPNRKLMVDCNCEGVLFIEADANFTLQQLGEGIRPPCPLLDELLYNVPGSDGILACPLLLIQVTRLTCGGFILALRLNHTMCDGSGLVQLLNAIADMAKGAQAPSLLPTWRRELLNARDPPRVTCIHDEYDEVADTSHNLKKNDVAHRSLFFGPKEISTLRNHLPLHLKNCSTFELITACLWKCRTAALDLHPNEIVRVSIAVNARGKRWNLHLPLGYYGNAFVFPAAISKVEILCKNSLGYAVELVKKIKTQMSEEYIKSVADLMVIKGPIRYPIRGNFIVSDVTHVGLGEVDFGWGRPLCAGPAGPVSLISFHSWYRNKDGEDGIVVPICLPKSAVERFHQELKTMTGEPVNKSYNMNKTRILSSL